MILVIIIKKTFWFVYKNNIVSMYIKQQFLTDIKVHQKVVLKS